MITYLSSTLIIRSISIGGRYFHPFIRVMENIRLCFNILDKYFVWYQRNLMVFDYDLIVSDAF